MLCLSQNFTYTWFCRSLTDPEHPMDADGRPKVYNSHAIPVPLAVSGSTGGGCFGKGPGKEVFNKMIHSITIITRIMCFRADALSGQTLLSLPLNTYISFLILCPHQSSLASLNFSPNRCRSAVPLRYSFVISSNLITPMDHLNIFSSVVSNSAACIFFIRDPSIGTRVLHDTFLHRHS